MTLATVQIDRDDIRPSFYYTVDVNVAQDDYSPTHFLSPKIRIEDQFDDPMVVSDDKDNFATWKILADRAIVKNRPKILGFVDDSGGDLLSQDLFFQNVSDASRWQNYLRRIAFSVDRQWLVGEMDRSDLWNKLHQVLLINPLEAASSMDEIFLSVLGREYEAILGSILEARAFDMQEPYKDSLGGIVLDFLRKEERITYIVSETAIQVLHLLEGKVVSKLFQGPNKAKVEVAKYTEQLFEWPDARVKNQVAS